MGGDKGVGTVGMRSSEPSKRRRCQCSANYDVWVNSYVLVWKVLSYSRISMALKNKGYTVS